jgi:hypothetical protein
MITNVYVYINEINYFNLQAGIKLTRGNVLRFTCIINVLKNKKILT